MTNIYLSLFSCLLSFIPGVFEIQTENSEVYDEFGSQEQHSFKLRNDDPESTTNLIQKLYQFFTTGELGMKPKKAQSEGIAAPTNEKQRDEQGKLEYNRRPRNAIVPSHEE